MEQQGLNFKTLVQKASGIKKYLLSKWKLLMAMTLLGAGIGVAIVKFNTTKYVAECSVLLGSSKGGLGGALKMAQSLGVGGFGGGDQMTFSTENAPDIVKSKRIIINTLLSEVEVDNKKDKLINFYIDWFGLRENWKEKNKKALINFKFTSKEAFKMTFTEDSIMKNLIPKLTGKNLVVKGDMKTGIVEIAFSSEKERFSLLFTKELLKAISHFYLDESVAKERRAMQAMQDKTDSIYTEMITRERALARIKDQSFRNVMMQGMVPQIRLQRDIEILNVMYSLALKNLEMSKMTMTEKQPVFQIIDEPILPLMIERKSLVKTTVIFAMLFAFLTVAYLLLRREIKKALQNQ